MGYRKFRGNAKRDDYYRPPDDDDDLPSQLVTAADLAAMTGCSKATIHRFASQGTISGHVGENADGAKLWDPSDERLAEWVAALRGAGYHLGPAACS